MVGIARGSALGDLKRSMPLATEHLAIVQSRAADDAGVIGASMLALHHALSPESIDAMA